MPKVQALWSPRLTFLSLILALVAMVGAVSDARALARAGHVAFLAEDKTAILVFGGRDSSARVTNDTYLLEYSGGAPKWRRLAIPGPLPPPRESPLAAYISSRRELLIIGGIAPEVGDVFAATSGRLKGFTDVWVLHLEPTPRWEELHPVGAGPPPLYGSAGAFDPVGLRFILQGGREMIDNQIIGDLWELRLSPTPTWAKLETSGEKAKANLGHQVVYDRRHEEFVTFGGIFGGHELWRLPLKSELVWKSCKLEGAGRAEPGRAFASAAYDSLGNGVVVFGGAGSMMCEPDFTGIQLGVINETPGCCVPICYPFRHTSRPAPEPRVNSAIVSVPHRSRIEDGEEQLVAVVIGGRRFNSDRVNWSLIGPVYEDIWGFYERNPGAGQTWAREWRPILPVEDTALASGAVATVKQTTANNLPVLAPAHEKALRAWMKSRPRLRPLGLSDLKGVDQGTINMMAPRCGPDYHPCYVRGDFNGDLKEDFAVLLRDQAAQKGAGAIAIFNGPFTGSLVKAPSFYVDGYETDNWGLWCDRERGKVVLFEGHFESDNFTWFEWRAGRYTQAWSESP